MDDEATQAFKAFDDGLKKGREEGRDDERRRIDSEVEDAILEVELAVGQNDYDRGYCDALTMVREKIIKRG